MVKSYNERLNETRARSLRENMALYKERCARDKDTGILERVMREQIRDSAESDCCAGSR